MTKIENARIFYDGIFANETVTVAAETTLAKGTVLGRNKDKELVAFTTDNNVAPVDATDTDPAVEGFTTEPIYILAEALPNTTKSKATFTARVFDGGTVNKDRIIFTKTADKTDVAVLDALHRNGFTLVPVQDLAE